MSGFPWLWVAIRTWRILPGGAYQKYLHSIFLTCKCISQLSEHHKLENFPNHGGTYRFQGKFNKDFGERITPENVFRNMRGGILEEIPEGLELFLLFFCHFVGPEIGCTLILGFKENFMQSLSDFLFFPDSKIQFLTTHFSFAQV